MTNSILSVNNTDSTATYNRTLAAQGGELFASILQSKMNSAALSISDFSNVDGQEESSDLFGSSLYGSASSSDSLFGSSSLYGLGMMPGLSGNSYGSSYSSGINSDTMLMFIVMAMMLGGSDGEGSQLLLSSLASALSGNNNYNYRTAAYQNTQTGTFSGLTLTGSSYKSTYATPGTGSYPSSMGNPCSPSIVNNVGNRSAAAYNKVIEQFDVENSARYTPYKNGSTYCNIYVWDVTSAMGAQIPHRVDSNGDIATSSTKNVKYMTANAMYNWLGEKGKEYGWKEVSAEEAQKYANLGCPAVAAWKNPKGHGHIQMVVPSKDGQYNEDKGVAISQAGSKVIEYGYITDVYSSSKLDDIKYFVHA